MKVILLQDVKKVGRKFEVKEVSSGYAQNNLIPKKLAIPATPEAKKKLQQQIAVAEKSDAAAKQVVLDALNALKGEIITAAVKANDKGSLYAKLHAAELANMIKNEKGLDIDSSFIQTETLTEIGEYDITVSAFDLTITYKLVLQAE